MKNRFSIVLILLYTSIGLIVVALIAYMIIPNENGNASEINNSVEKIEKKVKALSSQAEEGKRLFKESGCGSCHDLNSKKTGPALHGVTKRRKREWIYQFVKNSTKLIESGDKEAILIYDEYKIMMPTHDFLSNSDIDKIITYIEEECGGQGIIK